VLVFLVMRDVVPPEERPIQVALRHHVPLVMVFLVM
jgi:hypothetical protein